jgi:hypothetical protein
MKKTLSAKFIILILVLSISVQFSKSEGAEWELYAENQNFSFYFDTTGIKKLKEIDLILDHFRKRIAKVWTRRVTKGENGKNWQIQENKRLGLSVQGYENYEFTMYSKEINCRDKTVRVLSEADYTKDWNLLAKSETPYVEWKPIIPGYADEFLHKVLCNTETQKEKQ